MSFSRFSSLYYCQFVLLPGFHYRMHGTLPVMNIPSGTLHTSHPSMQLHRRGVTSWLIWDSMDCLQNNQLYCHVWQCLNGNYRCVPPDVLVAVHYYSKCMPNGDNSELWKSRSNIRRKNLNSHIIATIFFSVTCAGSWGTCSW